MSQMPSKIFHSILYLLLETKGLKREGDANCGLTLCNLNEQNGNQLNSVSSICSEHFAKEDFTEMFSGPSRKKLRLSADEIGTVAIPKYTTTMGDEPLPARAKRMVSTAQWRRQNDNWGGEYSYILAHRL